MKLVLVSLMFLTSVSAFSSVTRTIDTPLEMNMVLEEYDDLRAMVVSMQLAYGLTGRVTKVILTGDDNDCFTFARFDLDTNTQGVLSKNKSFYRCMK